MRAPPRIHAKICAGPLHLLSAAARNGGQIATVRSRRSLCMLGNEEHDLPRTALEVCNETVTIQGSDFMQSLNVAAPQSLC